MSVAVYSTSTQVSPVLHYRRVMPTPSGEFEICFAMRIVRKVSADCKVGAPLSSEGKGNFNRPPAGSFLGGKGGHFNKPPAEFTRYLIISSKV